jgi:hypothetical protein
MAEPSLAKHHPGQAQRREGSDALANKNRASTSKRIPSKQSVIPSLHRWRSHRWKNVILSKRSVVEGSDALANKNSGLDEQAHSHQTIGHPEPVEGSDAHPHRAGQPQKKWRFPPSS